MKILLVENSAQDADILIEACTNLGDVEVDVAQSRDSAKELIDTKHYCYDLAIFDLQIPTTNGALDEHVDHGLAAFVELGRCAPGTIRFVWTGKATVEAMEQLVREQDQADPFGLNSPEEMVKFFKKENLRACLDRLGQIFQDVDALDGIGWSWGLAPQDLDPMTKRVVNVFARRRGGALVHAAALGDGLSGSQVLRLKVKDEHGATVASVVGKVDSVADIKDELSRYERYVAPSLQPGAFAPLSDKVLVGANGLGGAFYTLVDPDSKSLFDVVVDDPARAAQAVNRLAEKLEKWREGAPQRHVSVADVRRGLLSDDAATNLSFPVTFDRNQLERVELYVLDVTIHGDLHGLNVFIDSDGEPILIDFAEVMRGQSAIDPVTLELSAILHPKSPIKGLWAGADPAMWAKADEFFANCPHADFLRAARQWAHRVAATDREVCAAAYAYCLRQLKYDDVDRELAEQLAKAALDSLDP